jgi:tetratricopeptide (TPR) repeat protein
MKTNRFQSILFSFVSLSMLFFALPGFADNASIKVKCVDSASNPVQAVNIVVSPVGSPKAKDKKSDSKGEAEFTKLDDGVYRVVGRKDGFEPALFEFVTLKGSPESVTLKLAAGADKKLYFEDPAQAQKALELMNQAVALVKENKFSDAEKLMGQAVELDPSNSECLLFLGITLAQQEKFDQAVGVLNRAAKVSSVFAAVPPEVGRMTQAQYQQAIDRTQQLLKQIPVTKGKAAYSHQKFDEAIAIFTDALKTDPNNSELYYYLAASQANAQKYDDATSSIDKAIQLKAGTKEFEDLKSKISNLKKNAEIGKANSVLKEGSALLDSGDAAGALKKFEEARNLVSPNNQATAWRLIAKTQAKLNQPDAAIQAFQKSIELADAKDVMDYRKSFAQFYLDQKKYEEMVNVLADTKSPDVQNLEQILWSIFEGFKSSEPKVAEMVLERVIKINPQNADAYFELGQLYYFDGKAMDGRTKELFAKYLEIGKDEGKLSRLKDMMVLVNRRSK